MLPQLQFLLLDRQTLKNAKQFPCSLLHSYHIILHIIQVSFWLQLNCIIIVAFENSTIMTGNVFVHKNTLFSIDRKYNILSRRQSILVILAETMYPCLYHFWGVG